MLSSRSLAVSLAIVLVITRTPASGFAIQRAKTLHPTTDLIAAESAALEVRHDLEPLRYLKALESAKTDVTASIDSTNITTKNEFTTQKATTVEPSDTKERQVTTVGSQNETIVEIPKVESATTTRTTPITTGTEINRNVSNTSEPTNFGAAVSMSNEDPTNVDITTAIPTNKDDPKSQSTENISTVDNDKSSSLVLQISTTQLSVEEPQKSRYSSQYKDTVITTDSSKANVEQFNSTEITKDVTSIPVILQSHKTRSVSDNQQKLSSEPSPTTIQTLPNSVNVETSSEVKESVTLTTIDQSQTTTEPITEDFNATLIDLSTETTNVNLDNDFSTTTESLLTETFNTETVNVSSTLPSWKKYKTIDRKRPSTTSTEETTSSDIEMTRAETSRISLEKVLNNTPIPSLLELKNDLLNISEYKAKVFNTTDGSEANVSSAPVLDIPATEKSTNEGVTQTMKLDIVSSKRAGFLDNTETTSLKPEEATTTKTTTKEVLHVKDSFGMMYETEVSDGEIGDLPEIKNVTGMESQSQLVEDAIKEELLMEKTLNENNLYKEAAHREIDQTLVNNTTTSSPIISTSEIVTEDMLSVKPITPEKKKNTVLYAVSPNYKPLKKLDVQAPKQFVRDPDDNSWRNESISSLGIVFKPKNASKSFKEVLKNKTTELSNLTDKGDKSDVPDLRLRLEKIAEVRKSKKKRINKFGDTVYSDYEESSSENNTSSREDLTSPMIPFQEPDPSSTTPTPPSSSQQDLTVNGIFEDKYSLFKEEFTTPVTTTSLKKQYKLAEYYDVTDEYDADYVNLPKIDLKKFSVTKAKETFATRPPEPETTPMRITYPPDRQPTIQYFPPTKKSTVRPKISKKPKIDEYDTEFEKKLNLFTYKEAPKVVYDVSFGTASPVQTTKYEEPTKSTAKPLYTSMYTVSDGLDKNLYLTNQPRVTELQGGFVPSDGNFNRASYVIKHYGDFINDVAKGSEEDKGNEYLPYTQAPMQGVTMNQIAKLTAQKELKQDELYDYDTQFRKDILSRFVDNFNQNSERFKVDFPILYNNSVVHRKEDENGKVLASSSAFMKRLYEAGNPRTNFLNNIKPCGPNCESMSVDLAPAYELHYYVPDQEEREEIEPRPNPVPHRFRL